MCFITVVTVFYYWFSLILLFFICNCSVDSVDCYFTYQLLLEKALYSASASSIHLKKVKGTEGTRLSPDYRDRKEFINN